MADFRIRLAEPGDATAIGAVIEAAYAPYRAAIDGIPDMAEGLAEDLASGLTWVTESAGQVTGVLISHASEGGLNILNLAVRPEAAGRGQGSALLSVAETFVRTEGGLELRVTTHRDMGATLAFYVGQGWQEIDREGVRVYLLKDLCGD